MYQFIICFLLFPFFIFANDFIPSDREILESIQAPLTSIYGVPDTNIFGVNAITGDYNYSTVDFNLPGKDPLILQRTYCSSNQQFRAFYDGWTHNLSGLARAVHTNKHIYLTISGSLSGELPLKRKKSKNLKVNKRIFHMGVTNCGRGEISGRNNLRNMEVIPRGKFFDVKNADGTEHSYYPVPTDVYTNHHTTLNHLEKTTNPNGLVTKYEVEGYFLNSVKALNYESKISNTIDFTGQLNSPEFLKKKEDSTTYTVDALKEILRNMHRKCPLFVEGVSGDGKTTRYSFETHSGKYGDQISILMSKFESNYLPTENYDYTKLNHERRLTSRYGERHRTTIDYYENGDKISSYGHSSHTVSSNHIALNRVKQIKIAVDHVHDLHTVYQFDYYKKKDSSKAFTDVYNQYNHLSRFHYSTKDYRLNCVEKYKGTSNYTLLSREKLCFGGKDTPFEGDFFYKTVETPDGIVHYGENYEYDERGNVLTKNCRFRKLTNGEMHPIIALNYILKGGEVKSTHYTYNALNLPLTEKNDKLETIITYHFRNDNSIMPLVKSKTFKDHQKIQKREFYEYDENACCVLKIEDDGSRDEKDDLADIYVRTITHIKNRKESFAGLPEEINIFGLKDNHEHLISRTVLEYDSHGYVEKESHYDADNKFAYFVQKIRDLQGNIVAERNPKGHTTNREYNLYGSLREEHGPSSSYFTEYFYDCLQRPIQETRHCSDGINLTSFKSYDLEGKITKTIDPYGFTTEYIYNELGKAIEIIHPIVRADNGEWVRPKEFKDYNFLGHLISETDPSGAITLYTPNDAGFPLKITYPDGTTEEFRYSLYDEIVEKIQKNGSRIIYTYDAFSRPTSEKIYDKDGKLLKESEKKYTGLVLISESDGEGLNTTYLHDYAGRVKEIRKGNTLIKNIYDSLGRVAEERRYFGEKDNDYIATVYKYDLLNRVRRKKEVDGDGKVHSKSESTYDFDGNVRSTTTWNHAGTAKIINTYDPRGNLSSSTDALGNTTHYIQRYDYFLEGIINLPCLEVTDPTGVKTITVTDSRGSVISTEVYSPYGKLLSKDEMYYDIKGNLKRKEHHLPNEIIETKWDYDSSSNVILQVNGAGTPEQITTTFTYNSCGELSKTVYGDGSSKYYIYDGVGRLSEEWSKGKSVHYHYKYNQHDLPKIVTDCNTNKKTIREYSIEGNLLSEEFENTLKIRFEYDKLGRVVECIYPDNSSIKQTYNPVFLTKIERLKNGVVVYDTKLNKFDLSGKPGKIDFPKNSGTLALKYDLLNRPLSLTSKHYEEKEIFYDTRGLLISKNVNNLPQSYDHDHLQQLTLEQTERYSHTYENDALNRQVKVDGLDQIHNSVHQLTHGIHGEYKFDDKGRRKLDSDIKFTYDRFDRLVKVKKGKSIWRYTYDAFNRKMSRTFSGKTIDYLYDGHEEIGSYDNNKQNLDLKVLSACEGSIPIAIELGDQTYAPLISSQGHIVGLVEAETGNLADESFVTMFGEDLSESPLSPWRFCGKRHETSELGIIDFGFRFYHPKSAQWLTQDPLGESDGPNLYAYVRNNPTCYVDRFGLFLEDFSFSNSWTSLKQSCTWEQAGIRLDGALRAAGGLAEVAGGTALAIAGAETVVAVPAGLAIACHGVDNYVAGFNQLYSGQRQDAATIQVLQKTGMSHESASSINAAMGISSAIRAKMCANSYKTVSTRLSARKNFLQNQESLGFTPQILEGNKNWGLIHILKRHSAESTTKNSSKFLQGIGRDEITTLVNDACKNIKSWEIAGQGLLRANINTGKIIGVSRESGNLTSTLQVVLKENRLHTAYPY